MLKLMDWFCGAGGSSQGAAAVPGVEVTHAANHWARAIETHSTNFPDAVHHEGDIRKAREKVGRWPVADLFWASPECPQWSVARGKVRDFDQTMQGSLFDVLDEEAAEQRDIAEESRALMEQVPLYLRGALERGKRVKAGVVENVVDVRGVTPGGGWDQWDRWIGEIRALGYKTRVIALNSMHAQSLRTPVAPQSRDRLYVAYWDASLGRDPDWSKWLRPLAFCSSCDEWVQAMQVFKDPRHDMGRYRTQYVYRCPHVSCRNAVLEPPALPAAAAIDWSLTGTRIGDRVRPLKPKTMERVRIGLRRYGSPTPMLVPTGGTWRDGASPVTVPMGARTTRENDALAVPEPFLALLRSGRPRTIGLHEQLATIVADGSNHALVVPPLVVPCEGRDGKEARCASLPLRAQTTRRETGLAFLPFVTELRGGGSSARSVREAMSTVTASGNHHGLVTPDVGMPSGAWESLMVPYYSTGTARPATEPLGTLPTRDRNAVASEITEADIDDVRFRMFEPHEIARGMAFIEQYVVTGNKRERVAQYGNAVTPPAAEILVSALVEAITGEELDRWSV